MGKLIQDQFTNLPISRQRRYQLRHEARGQCRLCDNRAAGDSAYCPYHQERQRILCNRVPRPRNRDVNSTPAPATSTATIDPQDLI